MYSLLIIEDEKYQRERFLGLLSQSEYWRVIAVAEDGEEAVRIIKESRPDIIFTDIMLPKIEGQQVIQYARSIPDYRPIIYAISDLGGQDLKRQLNDLEVNLYSFKSITDEHILLNLHTLLNIRYYGPDGPTAKDRVEALLYDMGAQISYLNSRYMIDAILMQLDSDNEIVFVKELCTELGIKHKTTKYAIESGLRLCIRNLVKQQTDTFIKVFGTPKRRITTIVFISGVVKYLRNQSK